MPEDVRPVIEVRPALVPVIRAAESALQCDPRAGIYQRGRMLVRVARDSGDPHGGIRRPMGAPVIEPLTLDALRHRLDCAARWVRPGRKGSRPAMPPEWVARGVLALDSWLFPALTGVIEQPTLAPDGRIVSMPGYDVDTGLLYVPSAEFPSIPNEPSAEQVRDAVTLLVEPFADFPWIGPSDRAAALAAVLTLTGRAGIAGPTPMFAVRAPAAGSGKGLLTDVLALIGIGRNAARTAVPRDDAELDKRVLAFALSGDPAVVLDNADGPIGSDVLAAALTATVWGGRVLGRTQVVRVPLTAVWITTGNNTTFRAALGRRVVPADIDARVEHPEDRDHFRIPDLLAWTREHRADLVTAALVVLRAFVVAGRPAHGRGPRMGSFERWDDLVRGACVWAGLGDPLGGRDRIRQESDDDAAALRAVLAALAEAFGPRAVTLAEAVAEANGRAERGDPALRDPLLGVTPNRDRLEARALGYAFRRLRGRIVGGRLLDTAGEDRSGAIRWVVRPTDSVQVMQAMQVMFPAIAGVRSDDNEGSTDGNITRITGITCTDSPDATVPEAPEPPL